MERNLDRRAFLKGASITGAAAMMGVCIPAIAQAQEINPTDISWDKEVDIVVVGSGTGIFGALLAAKEGASVVVLEKASNAGGTTALSGNGCWVPNNRHMAEHGIAELSDAEVVDYIDACDVYKNAPRALKENYVKRAHSVFEYLEDSLGLRFDTNYEDPKYEGKAVRGDYYPLPGHMPLGRSLFFCDEEGKFYFSSNFQKSILPLAESMGLEIMTDTAAIDLLVSEGTVIGVMAKSGSTTLYIKADKGVVLAAGGFDYNADMVRAYLRDPIIGSNGVPTNTGDAQIMGAKVGAALGNMASAWGVPFFKNNKEGLSTVFDWSSWRPKPYSLIVNKHGRRFGSEASAYSSYNLAFNAYDSGACEYLNLPAYFICDSQYVENYGYPGMKKKKDEEPKQPDFVQKFDTLEELAAGMGIDVTGLVAEVERFNTFAESGVDEDFHRGEFFHEARTNGDMQYADKGLKNPCMGPVVKAPFYVAEYGPGTCGTSGGIVVNEESCALKPDGTVIPGLYAAGNSAASIFGSGYPGAGATVAPGIFQAMVGVNHALQLNLF